MNKQLIRNTIRTKNLTFDDTRRSRCENDIAQQIEQSSDFQNATCIALFIALADELSTLQTINKWHTEGRQIALPVIEGETMQFYRYTPDTIKIGAFNIPAPDPSDPRCRLIPPDEIDLMIIPGVAFTTSGERLGRGGGFYDRYLASPNLNASTIGICYAHQIFDSLPTEPHDIKAKKVVYSSL